MASEPREIFILLAFQSQLKTLINAFGLFLAIVLAYSPKAGCHHFQDSFFKLLNKVLSSRKKPEKVGQEFKNRPKEKKHALVSFENMQKI